MSLDVYLEVPTTRTCSECGQEIPNARERVYGANVTHNLNKMAGDAGLYEVLWRHEVAGITKAWQLIEPLKSGIALMKSDPARFMAFNPKNGWGSYDDFVPWLEEYLKACCEHPDAEVRASR